MERVPAVFISPTDRLARWLRRYSHREDAAQHYHNAWFRIEDGIVQRNAEGRRQVDGPMVDHADPRWPTTCDCGYVFGPEDEWQVFTDVIYDNGLPLREAPIGSLWDAFWYPNERRGPDGLYLLAKCPGGGIWSIDGRASNCGLPQDHEHRCWVRHGSPKDGTIHVDKNGLTCQAGGGSIQTHNWHGFLTRGFFQEQRD